MNFASPGAGIENPRQASAEVNPVFLNRWSTRAFDPSPIPDEILETLFEAARWAPSCFNEQPWLFVYGTKGAEREAVLDLLVEGNKVWAKNAPVLAIVFAKRRFAHNDKPIRTSLFDCGAAWMSLSIQAHLLGLFTHGMAGFDVERSYEQLGISGDDYQAVAAIAIGHRGDPSGLPEKVQAGEKPNNRKPRDEIARVAPPFKR